MKTSSKRLFRRLRRILGAVLIVCLITLSGCRVLTILLVGQAERDYPPVGEILSVGGVPIQVQRLGSGTAVVLLHGDAGPQADFAPALITTLSARYTVIVPYRPGYGGSARPTGTETLSGQAQWLHALLNQLAIQRPTVVGTSWGGALALAYAVQYPVSGVVVVGGLAYPQLNFNAMFETYVRMARTPLLGDLLVDTLYVPAGYLASGSLMQSAFAPETPDPAYMAMFPALSARPSTIRAMTEDEDPAQLLPALRALAAQYATLQVPVYILTGDADSNVLPEVHAIPLHKALRNSCLLVVPRAGHMLGITQPGLIASAVDRVAVTLGVISCP